MGLRKDNTKWVLFLSSAREPDSRHVNDLVFGLQCLEAAGVQAKDIFIYIDGANRALISNFMSNGTRSAIPIKTSADFFVDLQVNSHESMVMFVTGHGGIDGIDANPPITPHKLLSGIKSAPHLNRAVIYLGQCHAGIFNYIGAGRKGKEGGHDPDVIFIGATNLHESLSSSTTETLVNGPLTWVANLFLLHVFKWISNPVDVDGDGRVTVMDSYKYAGVLSNMKSKQIKGQSFVESINLHQRWVAASAADQAHSTPQTQLALKSVEMQYDSQLQIRYVHQECWILNAIPAQQVEL
ncbi:hypothetical protein [Cupriavidus sp. a3]|uniref:hypothetical protein n=1 Tax=Cupriavidus sp. a3 TaxID=3242158 RepID=UPI003D9C2E75